MIAAGADRYRAQEALQALETAKVNWPIRWRGQGAHASADGSHDVRAAQRLILSGKLKTRESLALRSAVANSSIRYDPAGNPALEKARQRGRIDLLSALVIASGLAEIHGAQPRRKWNYRGMAAA